MTSSLPNRSDSSLRTVDVRFVDEPRFYARIAWPQVAALVAVGLVTLGPIALAMLLAL